jgi:hypothetical protein
VRPSKLAKLATVDRAVSASCDDVHEARVSMRRTRLNDCPKARPRS